MNVLQLVKDNVARFNYLRDGSMYYDIVNPDDCVIARFPIDITNTEDIGTASFDSTHKAITLMRYIRKALENNTLQTVGL